MAYTTITMYTVPVTCWHFVRSACLQTHWNVSGSKRWMLKWSYWKAFHHCQSLSKPFVWDYNQYVGAYTLSKLLFIVALLPSPCNTSYWCCVHHCCFTFIHYDDKSWPKPFVTNSIRKTLYPSNWKRRVKISSIEMVVAAHGMLVFRYGRTGTFRSLKQNDRSMKTCIPLRRATFTSTGSDQWG